MNDKLKQLPTIAATIFALVSWLYACATASEAEALPLLALTGAAVVCGFVAMAIKWGAK